MLRLPRDVARQLCAIWSREPESSDSDWPARDWDQLVAAGITRWTIAAEHGGDGFPPEELLDGAVELARSKLLVTFILSQFQAACQRLAIAASPAVRARWLPGLAAGQLFATVGISHLSTSRQHVADPAVVAIPSADGYRLTGEIPWVTGARRANVLVLGGTLPDSRQILAAVPADRPGLSIGPALSLLALSGSETCTVMLDQVAVLAEDLIAGPVEKVMQLAGTGGAGSLMTSALGLGHACGCIDRLQAEAAKRPALQPIAQGLLDEAIALRERLLISARQPNETADTPELLRTHTTDLALRASQSLLTASKGAGFVAGHPAERLAREALFFLVWSCPQAVANNLLESFTRCDAD